jgi:hypothetical protein
VNTKCDFCEKEATGGFAVPAYEGGQRVGIRQLDVCDAHNDLRHLQNFLREAAEQPKREGAGGNREMGLFGKIVKTAVNVATLPGCRDQGCIHPRKRSQRG